MENSTYTKQAHDLFKQGKTNEAEALLKEHLSDDSCQSMLIEYYIGEQLIDEAMPLVEKLAASQSAYGLVAQSILAFLNHDFNTAINLSEQALQQDNDLAVAQNHLGRALQNAGQSGRAIKAFKAAVRINPDYAEAWHNYAHTRRALGVMDQAVEYYKKAIECHAEYQSAWFNLAITLSVLDQHQEALSTFEKLLKINDQYLLGWVNAGLAHHVLGAYDQAIVCFDKAMDLAPEYALTYSYKGILLNELQQTEQATRCLKHSIQLDPNEIDAWCELTNIYEKTNDLEQAKNANKQALTIDPHNPTALIDSARILKRNKEWEQALNALNQVNEVQLPQRKAIEYWFEKAEILDKLEQFESAYDAFKTANELATQNPRYQQINPEAFGQRLKQIKQAKSTRNTPKKANWLGKLLGQKNHQEHSETGANLCFLVGFPRSGTTLLDTILAVSPEISSVEEKPTIESVINSMQDPDLRFADKESISTEQWGQWRQTYWQTVQQYTPIKNNQIIVDKLPLRFLEIAFITKLFPDAKFIFSLRHPGDVVLSNFMQNFAPTEAFIHFNKLSDSIKMYDQCMDYWLSIRQSLGQQLKEIKYEDLVAKPEQSTQSLCQFLAIPYHPEMLDKQQRIQVRDRVQTNSYAQVAEDIHQSAVARWKNYQPHLSAFKDQLNKYSEVFNYPLI